MLKCKLILAFLDADWVGPQQPVCNFYDQILSSHVETVRWEQLRWPSLAKESTMRKFTLSFRMRILLQCLDCAGFFFEP